MEPKLLTQELIWGSPIISFWVVYNIYIGLDVDAQFWATKITLDVDVTSDDSWGPATTRLWPAKFPENDIWRQIIEWTEVFLSMVSLQNVETLIESS